MAEIFNPPRLNERCTLQRYVQDGEHESTGDWVDVDNNVRTKITPKGGSESSAGGQQIEATHDHEVLMRYREGISTQNRLIGPLGEVLNIKSAAVLKMRGWWLRLGCVREG